MIIKDIHIDGFGIFHDFSLSNLGKGVNILLGENEAGKSTLLKFIRYSLFGYPRLLQDRMQPLNGGNHGGRIRGILSSGKEALFERGGNDKIRLLYDGQESGNISQWSQLLGNASADLYNNVYAFTLDELVSMTSIHDSKMEDKIFSLGLGLGNTSLAEIEKSITAGINDIYTARGKVQEVPSLLKEIDELRRQIRMVQDHLPRYRQLTREVEQLENQAQQNSAQLKESEKELARVQMYLQCYESFVSLQRVEADLKTLPPWQPWPEKGPQQMEQALDRRQDLRNRIKSVTDGDKQEKGIKEIEHALSEIHFNGELLKEEAEVEYVRLNVSGYRQTLAEREEEGRQLENLDQRISETISGKISSKWREQDVRDFRQEATRQSELEQFGESLKMTREEKRDWEAQEKAIAGQKSPLNTRVIAQLLAVVFVIGAVPFFYLGMHVAGAALMGIALVFLLGRKAFDRKDPLEPIRQKIKTLEDEEMRIIRDYNLWLQNELKFPVGLTFQAAANILQTISSLKEEIDRRDRLRLKIQEQRLPFIRGFEDRVNALGVYLAEKPAGEEPSLLAQRIVKEYDENRKRQNSLDALTEELDRRKKELQQLESNLAETEKAISRQLATIGAENAESYFLLYQQNARANQLRNQRTALVEKIETLAGYSKLDEVVQYLSMHEKQDLELHLATLTKAVEEQRADIDSLNKQIGSAIAEKQRIAGESDLALLLTRLENYRQKLRDAWKKWMSGQLALQVLSGVKTRFEKEKQPEVIQKASGYLSSITSGRYPGIRTSLEGREVTVIDQQQASKTPGQLSRGTREQLLVSLRMGFIEEYETQAEPLPVIVDEILVNFDPRRARKTAEIITRFAQHRQLLLFTCHPATMELFDKEKVHVVNLA